MLTNRQLLILQTIINDFIESAEPIGSRALSKKKGIDVSAATIRNVMADLEDMGLIEKTHSSSGRIPSEIGYRYYVDHVISPSLKSKKLHLIRNMIDKHTLEVEQIAQFSAGLLSQLTNYTAIILGPSGMNAKLKQIQIILLSEETAVAILITDTGHVEHKAFSIHHDISMNDLEKVVNILNEQLKGVPIHELTDKLQSEVFNIIQQHIEESDVLFDYLNAVLQYDDPAKVYVGGSSNMMIQPDFKDINVIYDFYTMLEDEAALVKLLTGHQNGLKVTIGNENKLDAIKQFSLITSPYKLGNDQIGTIALFGPTRMEYRKVLTLLQALSKEMGELY